MKIRTLLARIKRKLLKKAFLKDKRYPGYWMHRQLQSEKAFLLQIGSNDGKTGDPLYPLLQKNKHWRALFVEPLPDTFQKLKANYSDAPRFTFENVAINEGRRMDFYWVDPAAREAMPDLPHWYNQLASFDRQHILKHFDGQLAPFIRTRSLEGITLTQLLERNQIKKIDVLHIDAEGYDWKILSQLPLQQYQPRFILFEHHHLSAEDLLAARQFLQPQYHLFTLAIDTLAVSKEIAPRLIQQMQTHLTPGPPLPAIETPPGTRHPAPGTKQTP